MSGLVLPAYLQRVARFSRNARLFLASSVLAGIGSGVYSVIFNLYLIRLGFREDLIGQVAGLGTLATGLAAIPAGMLADRIGRRLSMLLGSVVLILAYLAQTLVIAPWAILACGMVGGAAVATIMTSMNPFLAENSTPTQRTALFAWNSAVMTLSSVGGSLGGGLLARFFAQATGHPLDSSPMSYRLVLWVAIGLFTFSVIPFYLMVERRLPATAPEPHTAGVSMASDAVWRRIVVFALISATVGIGAGLIIPFFNVYFVKQYDLTADRVGAVFAVAQALIGVSTLLAPWAGRRMGKVGASVVGHLSGVPFLLVLATSGNAGVAVLAYWGRAIGVNMVTPLYSAFVMEMIPSNLRGTAQGITGTAWNVAWAAGAALGGLLIVALGYSGVFVLASLFYAAAGAIIFVAFRRYGHV